MYQPLPGLRKYEVPPKQYHPHPATELRVVTDEPRHESSQRKRPGRRKWLLALAAVAVVAVLAGYGYSMPQQVETAVVVTAYPSQAYSVLSATGYVQAQRKAAVASKAQGRLEWLGVSEGSVVKEGEVIARLESRDVLATLANTRANVKVALASIQSARADWNDANTALQRARSLEPTGALSRTAMDEAVSRELRARAAVESAIAAHEAALATQKSAQVQVDYTNIEAPFDGVVLSKAASVGDNVTPLSSAADSKGAVVTIADMSTLEVDADVAETSLGLISAKQPCEIVLDALPNGRFRGVVNRIVPTLDRAKGTVLTKVRFIDRDPRVLPEMSAKVTFLSQPVTPEQQQPVTAVDARALVERDGRTVLYAIRDGRALAVAVERGPAIGDLVQVKGWLMQGENLVVLSPGPRIRDGSRVVSQPVTS